MAAAEHDRRVLIFAPIGRDGPASAELLRRSGIEATVCSSLAEVIAGLEAGAGAVFLSEEALFGEDASQLTNLIASQPAWSDLPFIVLTSHQEQRAVVAWRQGLVAALRNVSFLERPVQPITLTSSVQSALRARTQQYEVRALLEAREKASQELERLVVERTRALEEANVRLRTEMAERARAEEGLRQAQKIEALGQLTGGVAHDFNNLLMVISGGLQMLERQNDPARRRRLMDGMHQAAQRGAGLTRQLLAFARRQDLRPEPVHIAREIETMGELLDRSLGADVQVDFDFDEDLWPVEVDPGELELALLNLAVNARDAMPEGGKIIVRGENAGALRDSGLDGDYVRLSVVDKGRGMPAEVRARAFEPFFTTKDVGRGSGLGLAQVHGFATQSKGAVRIDSEPGRGTTITLYLPRTDKIPAAGRQHSADLSAEGRPERAMRSVLLVEDDDEVAALVSEMLGQLGYEVTRAASGAAALGALADDRKVDIVFSDVMMPGGMNGVELARQIRARRRDLPILLTSGYAEAAKYDAEAAGVRILPKPYRLEELSAALAMVALDPPEQSMPAGGEA
jgi:signal transduction histidine kinase/ActR/RegA family two-component response regulator